MADKSAIEWTDATWNPTVGCSIVSPGCTSCYAMRVANGLERRFGSPKYRDLTKIVNGKAVWTGKVRLDEESLLQPLKWKRGRRIFVNSMSDLFHEALSDADIDRVFAVMALCPQHTFQVLTKRAERMREYCSKWSVQADLPHEGLGYSGVHITADWPLPNVWLGVSVERQQEADERLPHLVNTPAAIRFVSYEPALGLLSLQGDRGIIVRNWLGDRGIDWVICGGESGPAARPMHPDWARTLRDQCAITGVPFFFKQWGAWLPKLNKDGWTFGKDHVVFEGDEPKFYCGWPPGGGTNAPPEFLERVGKKAAGRLLDGVTHDGFPEVTHARS